MNIEQLIEYREAEGTKVQEKIRPSTTSSTTNPTWPDLGSNPGHKIWNATTVLAMAWKSPSWEAGSTSASQNIPHISWNREFINASTRACLSIGLSTFGFPIKILSTFLISLARVMRLVQYSNCDTHRQHGDMTSLLFLQEKKLG
jgi:hypothetical protein